MRLFMLKPYSLNHPKKIHLPKRFSSNSLSQGRSSSYKFFLKTNADKKCDDHCLYNKFDVKLQSCFSQASNKSKFI